MGVNMNIIDEIIRFFMSLIKQRQQQVESRAKAKMLSMQTKAKTKAAASFNKAIDAPMKKGKDAIKRKK